MQISQAPWQMYDANELRDLVMDVATKYNVALTPQQLNFCVKSLMASQERYGRLEDKEVEQTVQIISGRQEEKPTESITSCLLNRGRGRPSNETLELLREEYLKLLLQTQQLQKLISEIRSALKRYDDIMSE